MVYKIKFLALAFLVASYTGTSQNFTPLIDLAWSNNNQLKAKNFNLASANADWQEAKAMFGPTVGANLQYTLAYGGRTIDLPIGDLMNPVYSTLNQITQTNDFPQIENTAIQFLPNNFYDAKIRATQPIYYPDLMVNRDMKAVNIVSKELEIKAFKRQLSRETMDAYFQHLIAREVIEIYKAADTLLLEAKRVTESMIRNGIATPLALARIENQIATVQSSTIDAKSMADNATDALRYTLGINEKADIPLMIIPSLPDTSLIVAYDREEILQLANARKFYNLGITKESQFYRPRIGAFIDLGSQDFNFGFQPYVLGGINLDINLYDHKRYKYKINSYKAQLNSNNEILNQSTKQVNLFQKIAHNNLTSAVRQAKLIDTRISMTRKVFNDALRRYKEGAGQYLEIIDAQNQVTQVAVQYNLARLKAWQRWSEYVYATANYPID